SMSLASGLAITVALVLLGACGPSPGASHHAAEPATASPQTRHPAGTVVQVGPQPEGIVYDAQLGVVAVAVRDPDRLLVLNGTDLSMVRSVLLPGSVRHLQAGAPGTVLVPVESSNQLDVVTLADGSQSLTSVGRQPHDAAAVGGGDVVVGNEFGHSIAFVHNGAVGATISDVQQPGGIVGYGATVAVIDVNGYTVSTYDVATMTRVSRAKAGRGPTHGVLLSGQRLAVADTRGNAVLLFDVSPLRQVGKISLPGTPYGMAVDNSTHTVWITLTARNEVVGIDTSSNSPKVIARYPTVRQPNTVAVQPGSHRLWITGTVEGVVERIDVP
ncbi:MAG: YncE family protein, partial [Actinomycetota bacterium]|nr:YncE family protein [Actinomycetota bacterium]